MIVHSLNKNGVIVPSHVTNSFTAFNTEAAYNDLLVIYLNTSSKLPASGTSKVKENLKKIFEDSGNDKFLKTTSIDSLLDAKFYEFSVGQMCYSRLVDNLLVYFKDILSEVVVKNPRILSSNDSESLEFILKFNNITDLQKAIAEKKLEELFYKGIEALSKFFKERTKIDIFSDEDEKYLINKFIKKRNLIVHNRGRINSTFIKNYPEDEDHLKNVSTLFFSYEDLISVSIYLHNFVLKIDKKMAEKYHLHLTDF